MNYPGHVIVEGERDKSIVNAIQAELDERGYGPLDPNGVFGAETTASIKLFQARNVDSAGVALKQDGRVGPLTWTALFGPETVPTVSEPTSPFLGAVLSKASTQVGVLEDPKNSNSGPEVNAYLQRAGVSLSLPIEDKPWCCAFVYWCFDETANSQKRSNPMMKTARCMEHWAGAIDHGARRVFAGQAVDDPGLVRPGMIFVMDHGGRGHTGLIERVGGGLLFTIEGNTDASRTREGGGVYRLTRKFAEINTGFIDYGAA
jgi:Putative peptidoglycan binding domain/CHAP domain